MPVEETGPVWDVSDDDETDVLQEEEVEVVQEAVAHGTVVVHEADVEHGTDIQSYSGGLRQVMTILKTGGLSTVNIIIGIDFNRTNQWKGKHSFDCNNLHATGCTPNPYQQVISILEKTLAPITEGNMITCYGFGDETTQDKNVFAFHNDHLPCRDFHEVLSCYKKILQNLKFAGRTSYAPVVDAAIDNVEENCGVYHILFIITDGQDIRSSDARDEELSPQEEQTIKSIVDASSYPLSIVLVGVGDGPWDDMQRFKEKISARGFDNFQFVNFTEYLLIDDATPSERETLFAVAALLQIPEQYKSAIKLGVLGQRVTGRAKKITPLPPPGPAAEPSNSSINEDSSSSMADIIELMMCQYCLTNIKNTAFSCGHMACWTCGEELKKSGQCPVCRKLISCRIRCIIDEITPLPPSVPAVGPSNSSSSMANIGKLMVCSHCKSDINDMVFSCGHMICSSCWDTNRICTSCPEISSCFRLFLEQ